MTFLLICGGFVIIMLKIAGEGLVFCVFLSDLFLLEPVVL